MKLITQSGSVRWALASLSLSMLMPSLDTSIANAGLPTLAEAFEASFAQVQWIVLAYLLAITTLIVGTPRQQRSKALTPEAPIARSALANSFATLSAPACTCAASARWPPAVRLTILTNG